MPPMPPDPTTTRLLLGTPEDIAWRRTLPAAMRSEAQHLKIALADALDREAALLSLLTDAADIIAEHAPGHTVWLRAASIATRSPHLGDSDV